MHICLHHYESLNLAGICPKDTSNCQTTCRGAVRFNLHRGACVLLFTRPASCRVQGREETVSVCSGEVGSCRLPPPPPDCHFTPQLCHGSCSSLFKQSLPSPFPILVSICLFILPSLSHPVQLTPPYPPSTPPSVFLLLLVRKQKHCQEQLSWPALGFAYVNENQRCL